MEKEVVLFSSLLPPPTGTQLDELFLKRGWQLQRWVSEGGTPGYQIYFGPGVQVDNHAPVAAIGCVALKVLGIFHIVHLLSDMKKEAAVP